MPIFKLQHVENTHLGDLSGAISASGGMARPAPSPGGYVISDANVPQATVFNWPIATGAAAHQYSLNKVINFDPDGAARVQSGSNGIVIPSYVETGCEASHGTEFTTSSTTVAIQIEEANIARSIAGDLRATPVAPGTAASISPQFGFPILAVVTVLSTPNKANPFHEQ
jgi:hypothetical protein